MRRYRKNPEDLVKSIEQAARILGVSVEVTPEQAKRAFREKSFEAHPDRGGSTEAQQLVNSAYELFLRRFDEAARAAESAEEDLGSLFQKKRKATLERVRPTVSRPYYSGEVVWPNFIPKWEDTAGSAVVGLRADGQVDLLVNNTYITTLPSLLGILIHLKDIIGSQVGEKAGSWERYIVYIARQSTGSLTAVGLKNFWEQVMFEEGGVAHAPDVRRAPRSKPDDFS